MSNANTKLEQEISVEQLGTDPDILLEYSKEIIPFSGSILVCRIVSNVEWKVEISEQYDWIEEIDQVMPTAHAFVSDELLFKIEANVAEERKGEIVNMKAGRILAAFALCTAVIASMSGCSIAGTGKKSFISQTDSQCRIRLILGCRHLRNMWRRSWGISMKSKFIQMNC